MSGLPTPRTPEGQAALGVVAAEPNRTMVALDYDGTWAAVGRGGPVGPSCRDSRADRAGHYGLERWSGGRVETPPVHPGVEPTRRSVADLVAEGRPGLALEDKRHSVALHTRRAADPAGALAAVRPRVERLANETGLVVTPGRFVLELRPSGTDKGAALRALVAFLRALTKVIVS